MNIIKKVATTLAVLSLSLFLGSAYSATLSPTQSVGSPFDAPLKLAGTAGEETTIIPTLEILPQHQGEQAELYAFALLDDGPWIVRESEGWQFFSGEFPHFKTVTLGKSQTFDLYTGLIDPGSSADVFYGYRLSDKVDFYHGNGFHFTISETARKLQGWIDDIDKTAPEISEEYDNLGIPGVVLAVTIPGEGEWMGFNGVSDLEKETPIAPDHQFRVGSITKTFTAMLILQLAEEEKLTLDDFLNDSFPNGLKTPDGTKITVPNGDKITIRHLLNHTSTVQNFTNTDVWFDAYINEPEKQREPEELVNFAVTEVDHGIEGFRQVLGEDYATIPGKDWYYSNTNFVLLGLIAEEKSGNRWEDEIRNRFIEKLGLQNTIVPEMGQADMADVSDHYAHGYWNLKAQATHDAESDDHLTQRDVTDPSATWSSGNIISTVEDLKRWMTAIVEGELLNFAYEDEQFTLVDSVFGAKIGLGIVQLPTYSNFEHRGQIGGYDAGMFYDIDANAMVVTFSNRSLIPNIGEYIAYPVLNMLNGREPVPSATRSRHKSCNYIVLGSIRMCK